MDGVVCVLSVFLQPYAFQLPGRSLTTKLTTDIRGDLVVYERPRCQAFGSNNLPRDLCQHVFVAALAVFSDLNIDGCCDDHGVPLFVLSLLASHDSASLCVVLLNKI